MPRDKIILVVAFASGLLAFVLVFGQLNKVSKPAYSVVLAATSLSGGQVLSGQHLTLSKPVRNIKADDFFLQSVDAVGFTLTEAVKKGDPIRRSKTTRPLPSVQVPVTPSSADGVDPMPMPIPAGMRAMELGSAEVDKIPDLIQTGHFVDLFGFRGASSAGEYSALVFSAPVLDIQRTQERGVSSISIALTLDEAEAVSAGLKKGKLRLAVRTEPGEKIKKTISRTGSMEIIRGSMAPSTVSFATAHASDPSATSAEEVL
jgi:Flp pilus assembly protein CpaB